MQPARGCARNSRLIAHRARRRTIAIDSIRAPAKNGGLQTSFIDQARTLQNELQISPPHSMCGSQPDRNLTSRQQTDLRMQFAHLLQSIQQIHSRIAVVPIVAAIVDDDMKSKPRRVVSGNPAKVVTG